MRIGRSPHWVRGRAPGLGVPLAINERMARQLDCLMEEVRVLREAFTETAGRQRTPYTDEQRRRLAIKGKVSTPSERES